MWVVILKRWHQLFASMCKDRCSCFYKYFAIGVASLVRRIALQSDERRFMFFPGFLSTLDAQRGHYNAELFYQTADRRKQKGGKKVDFSIPPDEGDSVKVMSQDGATGQSSVGSDGRSH